MKTYTPSKLRANIYRALDEVIETGRPIAIERNGTLLHLIPPQKKDRLKKLKKRNVFLVDPESIVHCDWSRSWKPKFF